MSALPLTALRPLTFPSHRFLALVCLPTGRVLALIPRAELPSRSDARLGPIEPTEHKSSLAPAISA